MSLKALASAAASRFETELRCVAARCAHVAIVEPPTSHPACPKCGGPVQLATRVVEPKPSDPPSNVGEVIHSLDGPTIVTEHPEPPAELPPGSA